MKINKIKGKWLPILRNHGFYGITIRKKGCLFFTAKINLRKLINNTHYYQYPFRDANYPYNVNNDRIEKFLSFFNETITTENFYDLLHSAIKLADCKTQTDLVNVPYRLYKYISEDIRTFRHSIKEDIIAQKG